MQIANRGPELLGVNIAFVITAILACALRCFVRVRMVKAFGRDDWLMVLATLFFLMYIISSNIGVHYGTGRHNYDLSVQNYEKARKCWYFCYLFFALSMACSKLSIGFLLLRISVKKMHTWILYAAMLISVVAGGTFFFVCLFQCKPISYMWNKSTQSGSCVDNTLISVLAYTYSVFSIISDLTFAIIPGFLVWHLQLKRRAKVALIPLITMGCVASAAVVARMPFVKYFNSTDFLWATTDIAIWSTVEQGLAITAGSLATLRPLFFLAMQGLGLNTRPTGQRPSGYGLSASKPQNAALSGSYRQHDKLHSDVYPLATTVQTQRSDDEAALRPDESAKSPSWFTGSFGRPGPKEAKYVEKKEADNESERNLKVKSERSSEEDGMHIMVSKSFFITDEERGSRSSRGGPY
ncbi:Nn.00g033530.m01.CDS01 [Neocucurbitaria sp. VM-36]